MYIGGTSEPLKCGLIREVLVPYRSLIRQLSPYSTGVCAVNSTIVVNVNYILYNQYLCKHNIYANMLKLKLHNFNNTGRESTFGIKTWAI